MVDGIDMYHPLTLVQLTPISIPSIPCYGIVFPDYGSTDRRTVLTSYDILMLNVRENWLKPVDFRTVWNYVDNQPVGNCFKELVYRINEGYSPKERLETMISNFHILEL